MRGRFKRSAIRSNPWGARPPRRVGDQPGPCGQDLSVAAGGLEGPGHGSGLGVARPASLQARLVCTVSEVSLGVHAGEMTYGDALTSGRLGGPRLASLVVRLTNDLAGTTAEQIGARRQRSSRGTDRQNGAMRQAGMLLPSVQELKCVYGSPGR